MFAVAFWLHPAGDHRGKLRHSAGGGHPLPPQLREPARLQVRSAAIPPPITARTCAAAGALSGDSAADHCGNLRSCRCAQRRRRAAAMDAAAAPAGADAVLQPWTSTLPRRRSWDEESVARVANHMLKQLPAKVRRVVQSGDFKGDRIISLKDDMCWRIAEKDIRTHAMIIKPMITEFPYKVPSAFYCADVLLKLNVLMGNKLLKGDDPTSIALAEGGKLKKLIGALRGLFRHSEAAKNPVIADLKKLLRSKAEAPREAIAEGPQEEEEEEKEEEQIEEEGYILQLAPTTDDSDGDADDVFEEHADEHADGHAADEIFQKIQSLDEHAEEHADEHADAGDDTCMSAGSLLLEDRVTSTKNSMNYTMCFLEPRLTECMRSAYIKRF